MIARRTALIAFAATAACRPLPPHVAPPRAATSVAASFGKTWDAVIDIFASSNLSIATLDRSSGLIVPADYVYTNATKDDALRYADCGKNSIGQYPQPERARFNVVVRGDSTKSTVQVRAFFIPPPSSDWVCESRGIWEASLEERIASRAEGRSVRGVALAESCASRDMITRDGDNLIVVVNQLRNENCVSHTCNLRGAALTMRASDAYARCRDEAAKSPED